MSKTPPVFGFMLLAGSLLLSPPPVPRSPIRKPLQGRFDEPRAMDDDRPHYALIAVAPRFAVLAVSADFERLRREAIEAYAISMIERKPLSLVILPALRLT